MESEYGVIRQQRDGDDAEEDEEDEDEDEDDDDDELRASERGLTVFVGRNFHRRIYILHRETIGPFSFPLLFSRIIMKQEERGDRWNIEFAISRVDLRFAGVRKYARERLCRTGRI